MNIQDAIQNVNSIFLDSAPVIYFVEKSAVYFPIVEVIFDQIDQGVLRSITSPITLSECLVVPYRNNNLPLQTDFIDLIVYGQNTIFAAIDSRIAIVAGDIRARYNLKLPDAFQVAIALENGCDAILTNANYRN